MTAFSIEALNVTLDDNTILVDADARFGPGIHAVVGRSGAGKSVLMKAACGLLPATSGHVHYPTTNPRPSETLDSAASATVDVTVPVAFAQLRQCVSFVHQDPALLDEMTVLDNLEFVLKRRSTLSQREREDQIRKALMDLELVAFAGEKPRDLSPGICRQVALARALLLRPQVLIADEPTTGLDPAAARDVDRALLALAKETRAILIVITHDLRFLAMLSPRLHLVHQGRVPFACAFAERSEPAVPQVLRAILTATPFEGPVGLETVGSRVGLAGLAP